MPSSARFPRTKLISLAGLVLVAALGIQAPAQAATAASYARNGEPTATSISTRGPEAVTQVQVSAAQARTFSGGQLFFPTRTQGRTVGAVILTPGLGGTATSLTSYGRALASQGFVVLTIDTRLPDDYSDERIPQILQAIDYVKSTPRLAGRVDPTRIAVAGYSLGGGASVAIGGSHPEIKAAIGIAPFYLDLQNNDKAPTPTTRTPTLIITGAKDTTAPAKLNGDIMYRALNPHTTRQNIQVRSATHESFQKPDADTLGATIAFLKLNLDGDTRYAKFVCPAPSRPSLTVSLSHCGG